MATCTITGTITDASGSQISNVNVKFNINTALFDSSGNYVVQREILVVTNTSGAFTMTLDQGISGILAIEYPPNLTDSLRRVAYAITIPAVTSVTLPGLIVEF